MTTIALHLVSESSDHYTYAIDLDMFETYQDAIDYIKGKCPEFDYICNYYSDYTPNEAGVFHNSFMEALKVDLKQAWDNGE